MTNGVLLSTQAVHCLAACCLSAYVWGVCMCAPVCHGPHQAFFTTWWCLCTVILPTVVDDTSPTRPIKVLLGYLSSSSREAVPRHACGLSHIPSVAAPLRWMLHAVSARVTGRRPVQCYVWHPLLCGALQANIGRVIVRNCLFGISSSC